jgi:hypothetical protein
VIEMSTSLFHDQEANTPDPDLAESSGSTSASIAFGAPDSPAPTVLHRGESPTKVGGPVSAAWREGSLTRAMELEALSAWVDANNPQPNNDILRNAVCFHLEAARQAAQVEPLYPPRHLHMPRSGSLRERAMSNLDAAEAHLLNIAPPSYLLGQMPSLLQHVRRHLVATDPRREELERIARRIGLNDPDHASTPTADPAEYEERTRVVDCERGQIVTAMRAASSAALREQVRLRSFRNVVVVTTVILTFLAVAMAVTGWLNPTLVPLCFAPEEAGQATVVCPTQQSAPFTTSGTTPSTTSEDIDDAIEKTARGWDILVVQLVGLTAAAVAAAGSIRNVRGSSEKAGLLAALAVLKLPTGAVTALLGLLLMRGQFVPGLSALDTSAQILAWALVFGYAQQLFTRLVDQQGQTVLDSIRGANRPPATATTTS